MLHRAAAACANRSATRALPQWAATGTPRLVAMSSTASNSSSVSWASSTVSCALYSPPVSMTLIQCTPCSISERTARRISAGAVGGDLPLHLDRAAGKRGSVAAGRPDSRSRAAQPRPAVLPRSNARDQARSTRLASAIARTPVIPSCAAAIGCGRPAPPTRLALRSNPGRTGRTSGRRGAHGSPTSRTGLSARWRPPRRRPARPPAGSPFRQRCRGHAGSTRPSRRPGPARRG